MRVMRASDRDREAAIRVLHDGRAEGRLSTATFEERVERALSARTDTQLRELTVDVKRISRLRARLRPRSAAESDAACLHLCDVGERAFVVGRGHRADLALRDETVSRRHAQIVRTADGFVLTDLASTNGTWLAGRRVGQVEVVPGDVIRLGDAALRLL
jgi:FHA domain/Domain of unknown function (DUF1707)